VVEPGEPAPEFTLKDQHNQDVSLADFRSVKNVVLMFYPYAFTRVCHGELHEVQDALALLENDDVQVLTVSVDTVFAHRVWGEQEGFTFPLLADFWPHGAVAQKYGVFDDQRGCAIRGTFLVDRAGVVRWVDVQPVPDARDLDALLSALAAL
jgi:peroxiredoxin